MFYALIIDGSTILRVPEEDDDALTEKLVVSQLAWLCTLAIAFSGECYYCRRGLLDLLYISRHLLSLNPLLACCRGVFRGGDNPVLCGCHSLHNARTPLQGSLLPLTRLVLGMILCRVVAFIFSRSSLLCVTPDSRTAVFFGSSPASGKLPCFISPVA